MGINTKKGRHTLKKGKKQYWSGRFYGLFDNDGKLLKTGLSTAEMAIYAYNFYLGTYPKTYIFTVDYVSVEYAPEWKQEALATRYMVNQVDHNIVNEETIPMELTWEMVNTKEKKASFNIWK